jgi:pSer/pThr/pTyr-binding forkhead associated (FHA) protein
VPTPLQLQIVFNPTQPRREVFTAGPIAFGRESDNRIVLPEAMISRRHGRIDVVNNQWVIFNDSDNGTLVNGKSVGKKGRVLTNRDVVSVGDRRVFEVIIDQAGEAESSDSPLEAVTPRDAEVARAARKRKLMFMVVGWLIGATLLGIWGATLDTKTAKDDGPKAVLTEKEIANEVLSGPKKKIMPDERQGTEALEAANQYYATRESDLANTYRAYRSYQLALACFDKSSFDDPMAQLRYTEVQKDLVKRVTEYYKRGISQFQSKQYEEAEITFSKLRRDIYPDFDNVIAHNVDEQRKDIGPHLKRKRK